MENQRTIKFKRLGSNFKLKNKDGNKKEFQYHKVLFLSIAVIILILDFAFIFNPDKAESETENRTLQQFPKLNFTTLTNGKFESAFDTYIADQFPERDAWVSTKSFVDLLAGKTESNGIFLGKDGYLIQDLVLPDEETYNDGIQEIRELKEAHPNLNFYALIAPTALSVYRDKLPANAPATDEDSFYDRVKSDLEKMGIRFFDVRETLKQAGQKEQAYYRTDHHWTTYGAYAAYLKMAGELDLPGRELVYTPILVSDSFKGTLTASSGFRTSETDPVYVYLPQPPKDYSVTYVNEGKTSASFYDTSNLNKRDHYSLFFNGNHPLVRIETGAKNRKNLLVIKDSYANSFVPFLAESYRKIVMVDPRYYTDDINSLVNSEKITDVLYLYNVSSFAE